MELKVTWSELKAFVQARSLSVQWFVNNGLYWLAAVDGAVELSTQITIQNPTPSGSDQADFETNFKPTGNQSPVANSAVQSQPPYGAKTVVVSGVKHSLFARFTGFQQAVTEGSNTISYVASYPWVKVVGIEVVNCTALDTASMLVYDNAQGTYSGVPNKLLNQFAFTMNMPDDFYVRMAHFDMDLYQGMTIQFVYTSVSDKTVGINILMDQVV